LELLPLIMCAIERHPESSVRDSLTHLLFNLIKRPDEEQRRLIMDVRTFIYTSHYQLNIFIGVLCDDSYTIWI
jgi:hypothetical protein